MEPIEDFSTQCPYCGEPIVLELDLSAGTQAYTEDCSVSRQIIRVVLGAAPEGSYTVDIDREND